MTDLIYIKLAYVYTCIFGFIYVYVSLFSLEI